MAGIKKSVQDEQNAARQAAADGTGKDTAAMGAPASGPQNGAQDTPAAEYTKFVYVGPPLPRGTLNHNAVFDGLSAGEAADCSGSQAGRGQRESANARKYPA